MAVMLRRTVSMSEEKSRGSKENKRNRAGLDGKSKLSIMNLDLGQGILSGITLEIMAEPLESVPWMEVGWS